MAKPVEARPDYYVLGGALRANAPSYVPRAADTQLLAAVRARNYSYVLTPRQMGKTSLMVRTAAALRQDGVRSVIVDLTQIGTHVSPEQWYLGHLRRVSKDLGLGDGYLQWWAQNQHLGILERFVGFLSDVAVVEVAEPIAIFIDEIDTTLSLPFSDDYFAAIRSLYIQRSTDNKLDRLTFVLMGVASPSDLIKDPTRTPFNVGTRIPLTDFTESEATALVPGLAPTFDVASQLLKRVLHWTGGHPYLTQKACQAVAASVASDAGGLSDPSGSVDDLVRRLFFSEVGRNSDSNLQFVRDRILKSPRVEDLLRLYREIRTNLGATDDELDPLRVALKLTGLVKVTEGGQLQVRNRIYEGVFDDVWISATLGANESATPRRTQTFWSRLFGRSAPRPRSRFRYDVYVSYSRRDKAWVVRRLVPELKRAGLRVFIDQAELLPGSALGAEIDNAMRQSRSIVVVMTPTYFESPWTEHESLRAVRLLEAEPGHRVIPLILEPTNVRNPLERLQPLDFTQGTFSSNMQKLAEVLTGD